VIGDAIYWHQYKLCDRWWTTRQNDSGTSRPHDPKQTNQIKYCLHSQRSVEEAGSHLRITKINCIYIILQRLVKCRLNVVTKKNSLNNSTHVRPAAYSYWRHDDTKRNPGTTCGIIALRGDRTSMFITVFTTARHRSLSWANLIHSTLPPDKILRSILIPSSHLRLGLPSGLFSSGFPTKTLYTGRQRIKDFSSNLCVQIGSGAHPASCTMCIWSPFRGVKARPGLDANNSPSRPRDREWVGATHPTLKRLYGVQWDRIRLFSFLSHACHKTRPPISPWFDMSNNNCVG
jgi:hypothetical protein